MAEAPAVIITVTTAAAGRSVVGGRGRGGCEEEGEGERREWVLAGSAVGVGGAKARRCRDGEREDKDRPAVDLRG